MNSTSPLPGILCVVICAYPVLNSIGILQLKAYVGETSPKFVFEGVGVMFEFEVLDGVGCGINPVGQLTKRPNVNSVPLDA